MAKFNIHVWRAETDTIPTKLTLSKKNIPALDRFECESSDNLFTCSLVSIVVLNAISSWCKVSSLYTFMVRDMLEFHLNVGFGARVKEVFHGVVILACWRI